MSNLLEFLFPKKSKWFDVGIKDSSGYYNLIQCRYTLKTNKKQFRTVRLGFINLSIPRDMLYDRLQDIESAQG
jgi:hypothetical protein